MAPTTTVNNYSNYLTITDKNPDRNNNNSSSFNECLKDIREIINDPKRFRLLSSLIGLRTKQRLIETAKTLQIPIPKHAATLMMTRGNAPAVKTPTEPTALKMRKRKTSACEEMPSRKRLRSTCQGDNADLPGARIATVPKRVAGYSLRQAPTQTNVPSTIVPKRATRKKATLELKQVKLAPDALEKPVSSRLRVRPAPCDKGARLRNIKAQLKESVCSDKPAPLMQKTIPTCKHKQQDSIDGVETPSYREVRLLPCHSIEATEALDDHTFNARHLRRENEERKIVKQDRIRQREQELRRKLEKHPRYAIYLPRNSSFTEQNKSTTPILDVDEILIQLCPKLPPKATARKNVNFG